ncbi:MAG: signal peptidase I [Verrucomicrobiota bacterium JB023]|nr:signal peptidase I [Verrucomicrobiota bacterium JB023]
MANWNHLALEVLEHFWKPKWKKEALATYKGGEKFLNYKRDLIEPDRANEIKSRLRDLKLAIRKRDQEAIKEASKQLVGTCEHSLRSYRPPDALAENIEVLFVAIAVALGIRAYYLQPFRIPTGSMQPTLNGIIGHVEPDPSWKKPNIITQAFHKVTEGRTYVKKVADDDVVITYNNIKDRQFLWFFTKTDIRLSNGETVTVNGSKNAILSGLGLGERMGIMDEHGNYLRGARLKPIVVKEGEVIVQGWVDTGDLVLVDKFSYHFRKPRRGEVFVFETRGIEKIISDEKTKNQNRGSHYIKRLVGVPGDTLRVERPNLLINGKPAEEKGIKKVMSLKDGYEGYYNIDRFIDKSPEDPIGFETFLNEPSSTITLDEGHGKDQYFAMGDNSNNSSDSRYWGPVDEYLLVGPGLFTLWPFEHFGFIR